MKKTLNQRNREWVEFKKEGGDMISLVFTIPTPQHIFTHIHARTYAPMHTHNHNNTFIMLEK